MHPIVVVAKQLDRRRSMSRFSKLSHVIWHCQYHIIWVPKYRYRVLKDKVGYEVMKTIRVYAERLGCEVVELNVQPDHVHFLVKVPPNVSISSKQFPYLKKNPYWGNHFWAKGYCVDTVGVNAEMIRKYVKYQERLERNLELDLD
jgi:putative transposase